MTCPLQVRGAECVVLAGDPKQLPPTVTSQKAILEHGLDRTLFDRICDLGEPPVPLITAVLRRICQPMLLGMLGSEMGAAGLSNCYRRVRVRSYHPTLSLRQWAAGRTTVLQICSTEQTIIIWNSTNDSLRSMRPGIQPLLSNGWDATAQPEVPSVASLGAAVKVHPSVMSTLGCTHLSWSA